jgi:hypothetical protein
VTDELTFFVLFKLNRNEQITIIIPVHPSPPIRRILERVVQMTGTDNEQATAGD